MSQVVDIKGEVRQGEWFDLLARLTDPTQQTFAQADFTGTVTVTVWDEQTHAQVFQDTAVAVSSVIFNALQTDGRWTRDTTGYNFRYTVKPENWSTAQVGAKSYRIEAKLTTVSFGVRYVVGIASVVLARAA